MIGLLGFAAIWGAGRSMRLPRWLVWFLAIVWWLILIVQTWPRWSAVPDGALATPETLRPPTLVGGDPVAWLALGFLTAVVLVYRALLRKVRSKVAAPAAAPAQKGPFRPVELDRYARHIILREIGGPGQRKLKAARVLVVGAGGLGSPVLLYLAAAGVGRIGVIDDDVVDNSNLQRQVIHTDDRIGMPKVQSALLAMQALNPFVEVRPYQRRLTPDIAADLIADHDLVLDGSDNFDTRYLVNRICAERGVPLIAAAITQWEGQLSLYHPAGGAPCYECVFPVRPAPGMVPTCAEAGVAAPLPGVIGSMMAMEAVKHLTGAGETLTGRLMIHDALYAETRVVNVRPRPDCPVCGQAARANWTAAAPAP
ncbi:MAG TPA: HesA/MoeB/ThiF family protein [Paracoccaceae bacterium]|nr:HesA/MoeB/ThiF family protein [Paracoccaceae bacterium]